MNKSGNNFWKYLLKPFRSSKDGNHELELDKIAAQEQKQFSFETLVAATKNFHPDHKLGQGGFGPVFKGKLEDGREIAVKQLSQSLSQGKKEFTNEAKLLARVQHRNVVTLLGYCAHGPEKLLVYEYVANESLDKHLFKSGRGDALDWKRRYDIITGVARGLLYLHEISAVAIAHRDIKAGNILLDDKWVPKIADFGMARLFPEDERHVNTRVAVTNGYMAPEYVMHGRLSPKADVYSFGVVVLELISGQKYSNFIPSLDAENLLEWAYDLFKKGKSLEVMDPRLASSAVPDQVAMCIQIGLLCTQSDPQYRPTMDRVVLLLSKKPRTLEEPSRPGYPGSRYRRPRRRTASTGSGELNSNTFGSSVKSDGHSATVTTSTSHLTSSQSSPHGKHPMQGNNTSTMRRVTNELSHVGKVAVQPDKQNLYVPDQKSEEEEDSEHLQLQLHPMHQYSDCGSTSGTAPEGGVLPKEELVQNLFPKDEESSTKLTEDLSGTNMYTLPHYIFGLVALQKLILRSCAILMMELPPEIGELTNLEVLDLEGTEILCLPKEIAKLVKLMCLKVSFYGYANQTVIPRRVLSNLSRLKELIIDVKPYGEWWDVEVEAIIDDLRNLKELTTLKLYLPTPELLKYLTSIFPGLANFRFTVGRQEEHFISRLPRNVEEEFNNREKLEKGLKFINGDCIPNEITKVLKHADAFFLQRHWTTESLSEFGHENLNEVKFFLVMECNEFRTIIDSEKLYQGKDGSAESEDFPGFDEAMALGLVERLIVRYMKNMESIWKGPVGKRSLSNLKSLALHTCPNLATLFTIDMLINLMNLEVLTVEDCPKINSLVSFKDSGSELVPFLPSLKKISLLWLPGLVSISNGLEIALKLERMVIYYCPKLEKLSTAEVSSKELKVIKGEKEWWDALKWYESDVSTELEDYLARLFIPLRRDGDLMAQLTEDEIAASGQGKVGSFKRLDCLSNFSKEELLEEIPSEELEEISSEELEEISSEEVGGFKILVASDASSGGSEKKRGSIRGVYATSNKSTPAREHGSVKFTLEEILRATENFSPTFKIGQGGFGTVYKGRLQDGTIVAIKRAKKSAYDKHVGQEFQNEIRTLAQIEHLSLVKYYGYLEHEDERVIVLEYVPNGTLRDHLDCMRGNILDFAARLDIAVDVAHAVTYLHMYTEHPIIHRDIKSSNILITDNLRAKVADFGFARLAADSDGTHVSTNVRGTGYLDPEYLRTYQLTEKSDVYSFGVLLVELVTSRRPIEPKQELKEQRITTKWAIKKFTDGDAILVLDPRLERSPANNLALEKTLELALRCLAPYRQNRPTMRRCAEILWSIRNDYRELSA